MSRSRIRTRVATRSAGGGVGVGAALGTTEGFGVAVPIGGRVMSGLGVGTTASDGSGELDGEAADRSGGTGTVYVSRPADRMVTPNAVSSAGSTRVRISSVGPAIGTGIVAWGHQTRRRASVLVPSAPACGPDSRSSPVC